MSMPWSAGHRSVSRGRRATVCAATVPLVGMALLATLAPGPAAAQSTALPPSLQKFAHCPVGVANVATCLFSSTTSTTFTIGSTTVTSSSPTTVSLGLRYTKTGQAVAVLPDDGSQALQSPAIPLPGGLTGIPKLDGGVLSVSVTPQLVGLPSVNLGALLTGKAPGLTLPIDVLISTPTGLLGPECTIGDAANPILLHLTTGTTSPPAPNKPISGSPGTTKSTAQGLITVTGMTLVDNSFAVPGTDNCGVDGVLDPILNLDKHLPSPAGSNTAVLSGSAYTAPASLIREHLS